MIENFSVTSTRVNNALSFVKSQLEVFKKEHLKVENGNKVVESELFFDTNKSTIIEFWLEELGFNYDVITSILASKGSLSGSQFLSASHRLLIDRETVIVTLREQNDSEVDLLIHNGNEDVEFALGKLVIKEIEGFPTTEELKNSNKAYLNATKLSYPLQLRNWKRGDVFQPFGMKGKKKVSDFLIDQKVSIVEKEKTMVLCSAGEIVWLVGHRISEKFKIDKSASPFLEVTFLS